MATLHLMVGLPGSGKTTAAKKLEEEYHALRLTPDEWHLHLFGHDFGNSEEEDCLHNERHGKIEELMWETAKKVLRLGIDVILDYGFWAREERDGLHREARRLGADFEIHYMDCPLERIWENLSKRNQNVEKNAAFYVTREDLEKWSKVFEEPTDEELLSGETDG